MERESSVLEKESDIKEGKKEKQQHSISGWIGDYEVGLKAPKEGYFFSNKFY